MNNTTEQNKNKELMNESEIKELVQSLLSESSYANYAVDGFIFLFKTLSEMAEQNSVSMIDLLGDLQRFVYIESIHCNLMQDKYTDSIHERYRKTNYEKDTEIYQEMKQEVEQPTAVLDLSSCSVESLSQGLSELMQNPNLPPKIQECLNDKLATIEVNK